MTRLPRFVFQATGTHGDLLPLISLARVLIGRGHDCHVLANASAEESAKQAGVPFTAVAPAQTDTLAGLRHNFESSVFAAYRPTFEFFESCLRDGRDTVVLNHQDYDASTQVCERFGLPLCRIVTCPFRIRSLAAPPAPWGRQRQGPIARAVMRHKLRTVHAHMDSHPFILARMNEHRAVLGLEPLASCASLRELVQRHVCWFPDWYCAPARDWPREIDLVGFPLPASERELPLELQRFIEREGAPLVFTPGTGVRNTSRFFAAAAAACELLGRPGVFLSPNQALDAGLDGSRTMRLGYVDLEPLLRRSALLVHHGGVGTTARALQAGVPQIVVPWAFDQPDNAARVSALGVGTSIEHARLSGDSIARAAWTLWQDRSVARALQACARRCIATDALARAADVITARFAPSRRLARPRMVSLSLPMRGER